MADNKYLIIYKIINLIVQLGVLEALVLGGARGACTTTVSALSVACPCDTQRNLSGAAMPGGDLPMAPAFCSGEGLARGNMKPVLFAAMCSPNPPMLAGS